MFQRNHRAPRRRRHLPSDTSLDLLPPVVLQHQLETHLLFFQSQLQFSDAQGGLRMERQQIEKPILVGRVIVSFQMQAFCFEHGEAQLAVAPFFEAREKIGIDTRSLPALQVPILMHGDAVPPTHCRRRG